MTAAAQTWKNVALRPLPAVQELTRREYIASYRFQSPVLVKGGAKRSAAVRKWDAAYLQKVAGDARVEVGHLSKRDPHDFTRRDEESMTLRSLLRALAAGKVHRRTYLFNDDSCLFLRNPRFPRRKLGWGASATNAGLARLAADFRVPRFVAHDYLFATLILGPHGSGTRLHYDWGGESKVMVQIRGAKRVTLMPPSMARRVGLSNIFDGRFLGNDARQDRPGGARLARDARGLVADMEPGDVLYFPAFWFHKVENSGRVNVAVGVGIDELPFSALAMRMSWYLAARALLGEAGRRIGGAGARQPASAARLELRYDGRRLGSLKDLFGTWEKLLLSDPLRSEATYWNVVQNLLQAERRGQ
jgi:hypothetical protein